jgi:hypothetical protein
MPRTFTLEEANALIPRLRDIITEMREKKPQLDLLRGELAQLARKAAGNGHLLTSQLQQKRQQADDVAKRLNDLLAEINGLGCEMKGLDQGLIDFPAEREGRVVYLCWQLGEDEITHWHETDAGFAGRTPL